MLLTKTYDVAVIGGGLAGLSLAIQLADAGRSVILFEKENYPFHRVCGEYISLESWNFLEELGMPLSDLHLPVIRKLIISAPNGKKIRHVLPLGGFGISRHLLDSRLAEIAKHKGVVLLENSKVSDIRFKDKYFEIAANNKNFHALVCAGCFGKRSNLDLRLKRRFVMNKPNKLNNYVGVKYHIQIKFPADTIALHNFENGYCGISKIEEDKYCFCYLTTANNLKKCNNSIIEMESKILYQNPHLKKIFGAADFLMKEPVVISQISFEKKSLIENHILMIGDAAGMITPLCGNGMSMALHSSKIVSGIILGFLQNKISRSVMEKQYRSQWNQLFGKRLQAGRLIQSMFGKPGVTNLFLQTLRPFPKFISWLIRQTHGHPF